MLQQQQPQLGRTRRHARLRRSPALPAAFDAALLFPPDGHASLPALVPSPSSQSSRTGRASDTPARPRPPRSFEATRLSLSAAAPTSSAQSSPTPPPQPARRSLGQPALHVSPARDLADDLPLVLADRSRGRRPSGRSACSEVRLASSRTPRADLRGLTSCASPPTAAAAVAASDARASRPAGCLARARAAQARLTARPSLACASACSDTARPRRAARSGAVRRPAPAHSRPLAPPLPHPAFSPHAAERNSSESADVQSEGPRTISLEPFPPAVPSAVLATVVSLERLSLAILFGAAVLWLVLAALHRSGRWSFVVLSLACATLGAGASFFPWSAARHLARQAERERWRQHRQRAKTFAPPYPESAEWLNALIEGVWGTLSPDLFNSIGASPSLPVVVRPAARRADPDDVAPCHLPSPPTVDTVEDIMQASLPQFVDAVKISDVGQGRHPIRLTAVRPLPDREREGHSKSDDEERVREALNAEGQHTAQGESRYIVQSPSSPRSQSHVPGLTDAPSFPSRRTSRSRSPTAARATASKSRRATATSTCSSTSTSALAAGPRCPCPSGSRSRRSSARSASGFS